MSRNLSMFVLAMLVLGMVEGPASAGIMYTVTGGGSGNGTGFSDGYTVGNMFNLTVPTIVVTALGVYDDSGDGLNVSHDVAIFDESTSTVVALATVASGTVDPLIDGFRYVTLSTPVALVAGDNYDIVTNYPPASGQGDIRLSATAAFDPDISYLTGHFAYGAGTLVIGGYSPAGVVYAGPNFLFVPEPASASVLLVSGLALLGARRRKI